MARVVENVREKVGAHKIW